MKSFPFYSSLLINLLDPKFDYNNKKIAKITNKNKKHLNKN